MTIGAAWNTDDPKKPWADWDADANLPIPLGFAEWAAAIGVSFGSYDVLPDAPMTCPSKGAYDSGSDTALIRLTIPEPDRPAARGRTVKVTIRLMGADGISSDDRTLRFKVKDL